MVMTKKSLIENDADCDDLMPRLQSSMRIVRKPSSRAWNAVDAEIEVNCKLRKLGNTKIGKSNNS